MIKPKPRMEWNAAARCCAATLLSGDIARAEEILRQLSPDGGFALRQGEKLELVALPSRETLLERALEQTPAAQRVSLRREQRAWLVQRDTEAWIHALQSWSPFAKARALEGKALATEKRNCALEELLNAKSTTL